MELINIIVYVVLKFYKIQHSLLDWVYDLYWIGDFDKIYWMVNHGFGPAWINKVVEHGCNMVLKYNAMFVLNPDSILTKDYNGYFINFYQRVGRVL